MTVLAGIDVGGTNLRVGLGIRKEGEIDLTRMQSFPVPNLGSSIDDVEAICQLVRNCLKEEGLVFSADSVLGVSMAAQFSRQTGQITRWPNRPEWNGVPFRQILETNLGIKVCLEDDANCAALAERFMGHGKGVDNFLYLTVSTGIGSGLVLNGKLYTGSHGWAGEAGHMVVMADGPLCGCGRRGCLQALASGPALLRRAKELAAEAGVRVPESTNLQEIVTRASTGTPWALQVFREAGRTLGMALANLQILLDFSLIILGGGVTEGGDVVLEPIRQQLEAELTVTGQEVRVEVSKLAGRNGVLGALYLAGCQEG